MSEKGGGGGGASSGGSVASSPGELRVLVLDSGEETRNGGPGLGETEGRLGLVLELGRVLLAGYGGDKEADMVALLSSAKAQPLLAALATCSERASEALGRLRPAGSPDLVAAIRLAALLFRHKLRRFPKARPLLILVQASPIGQNLEALEKAAATLPSATSLHLFLLFPSTGDAEKAGALTKAFQHSSLSQLLPTESPSPRAQALEAAVRHGLLKTPPPTHLSLHPQDSIVALKRKLQDSLRSNPVKLTEEPEDVPRFYSPSSRAKKVPSSAPTPPSSQSASSAGGKP